MYMEIHVHSTLAMLEVGRKKERQPRHITPQTRQTRPTITNLTNKGNMQHAEVHLHVGTGQIIKGYQDEFEFACLSGYDALVEVLWLLCLDLYI